MFLPSLRVRRLCRLRILRLLAALALAATASAHASEPPRDQCVVATISSGGAAPADRLRALVSSGYWVEADHRLLLCVRGQTRSAELLAAKVGALGVPVEAIATDVDRDRLAYLRETRDLRAEVLGRVLVRSARWALVEVAETADAELLDGLRRAGKSTSAGPDAVAPALFGFAPDRVLARHWTRSDRSLGEALTDPQIGAILDELDTTRWFGDVSTLAGWNRWTRGLQVLSARDWLVAEFSSLEGTTVTTSDFWVPPNSWPGAWGYNVIATIPGSSRPDDWYLVGGHYDSTSSNLPNEAPGADDNASGCAGVLELARLFSAHPPDATMIFVCFSGEEQGLYGSDDYVNELIASGQLGRIQGALVLDMIAYAATAQLGCILETETPVGQSFTDAVADAALDFTSLDIVREYGVCCSDHAPFLWAGRPAALAIEEDYPSNPNYHTPNDLPGYLQPALAGQILRLGAGAMLRLAGSSTIFVDGFESGGTLRWSALVPEAP
jgi:hypothetical protein